MLCDNLVDCTDTINYVYGTEMFLISMAIFAFIVFGLFSTYW